MKLVYRSDFRLSKLLTVNKKSINVNSEHKTFYVRVLRRYDRVKLKITHTGMLPFPTYETETLSP